MSASANTNISAIARASRRRRIARRASPRGILFAFLLAACHLLAQLHAKAEAHEVCQEHPGEVCHVSESHATAAHHHDDAPSVAGHAADPAQEPAEEGEHEHCPVLPLASLHGKAAQAPAAITVDFHAASLHGEFLIASATAVPPRAPLRFAPKTSPPVFR
jgi:hypothetical protein